MTRVAPEHYWVSLAALALLSLGTGHSARAQDDEEAGEVRNEPAMARHVRALEQLRFEDSVFGGLRSDQVRHLLEMRLAARLDEVDRDYALRPSQKKKLLLAGQGDIKHYFDKVFEGRLRCQRAWNDPAAFLKCWREVHQLQLNYQQYQQGIFGEESLFAKTTRSTITEEQIAHMVRLGRARETARYRSAVSTSLGKLVRVLDLSAEQYEKLEKLILQETRPPAKSGQSDHAYVMFQMAHVPRHKLKPLFEDSQWDMLSRLLAAWEYSEHFLRNDGFVFDDQPPRAPGPARQPARERRGATGQ